MIAVVTIRFKVPTEDSGNPFKVWKLAPAQRAREIKDWAENEFDGIAEYGDVISVEVSTAPSA